MSVCRVSENCDVYVFYTTQARIQCCGCSLVAGEWVFEAATELEMIEHLRKHQAAGDKVPEEVFVELANPAT